jgi:hypothetical protein
MGRESKMERALFKRMWNNEEISIGAIADHFGVTDKYCSQYAKGIGLTKRKTGPKLVVSNPEPAPRAPRVVSEILRTGGKYALLCAYADANGISYQRALQLYHIERAATK